MYFEKSQNFVAIHFSFKESCIGFVSFDDGNTAQAHFFVHRYLVLGLDKCLFPLKCVTLNMLMRLKLEFFRSTWTTPSQRTCQCPDCGPHLWHYALESCLNMFLDSGQQRTAEPQDPGDGSHVEEEKAWKLAVERSMHQDWIGRNSKALWSFSSLDDSFVRSCRNSCAESERLGLGEKKTQSEMWRLELTHTHTHTLERAMKETLVVV